MSENIKEKVNAKQIVLICLILLIALLCITIGVLVVRIHNIQEQSSQLPDTVINTVVIEKLKDDIKEQEDNIDNYKKEYEEKKERAKVLDDSAALQLFFELASE